MAELSVEHLQADTLTLASLVGCVTKDLRAAERRRVALDLIEQIWVKVWQGLPPHPRGGAEQPTATDMNALQVMASVLHTFPVGCGLHNINLSREEE
ncbi:MAG: hypothetical protein ACREJ6_02130 [Candidatus Methylomirabilis sp.]